MVTLQITFDDGTIAAIEFCFDHEAENYITSAEADGAVLHWEIVHHNVPNDVDFDDIPF